MKIAIQPVPYRISSGTFFEVTGLTGNPPITATWVITTDTGYVLETGQETMTLDDWNNWPAGNDNNYAERVIAARIGLTPV